MVLWMSNLSPSFNIVSQAVSSHQVSWPSYCRHSYHLPQDQYDNIHQSHLHANVLVLTSEVVPFVQLLCKQGDDGGVGVHLVEVASHNLQPQTTTIIHDILVSVVWNKQFTCMLQSTHTYGYHKLIYSLDMHMDGSSCLQNLPKTELWLKTRLSYPHNHPVMYLYICACAFVCACVCVCGGGLKKKRERKTKKPKICIIQQQYSTHMKKKAMTS